MQSLITSLKMPLLVVTTLLLLSLIDAINFPGCNQVIVDKECDMHGGMTDAQCQALCRDYIDDTVSPPKGIFNGCGAGSTDGAELACCFERAYQVFGCIVKCDTDSTPATQAPIVTQAPTAAPTLPAGRPFSCLEVKSKGPGTTQSDCVLFCRMIVNDSANPPIGTWAACGIGSTDPDALRRCVDLNFNCTF